MDCFFKGKMCINRISKSLLCPARNRCAKGRMKEIEELQAEEAEVKFVINTVGELGNMAIGKVGSELIMK